MKKLIIAFIGAILSSHSLANNIYVGAHLGMGSTAVQETATGLEANFGNSDPVYGAYIGYELNSDKRMFLALEAHGTLGESKEELKIGTFSSEMARKEVYGLHILAGVPMSNNTAIYFRLGGVRGKFNAKASTTSTLFDKNENGIVFGLGSRFALDDRMNLRLDYQYTKFTKFKFEDAAAEYDVRDQYFTVGLQYMF